MKITVALPVYNGGHLLAAALDSVLSQEGVDFELLISEGGSTDGTPEVLAHYAARDRRIRYLRHSERLAQVPNCNHALREARTPWVQFMCHDDILLPGALARIAGAIQSAPDSVVLVGHSPALLFRDSLAYDPWYAAGGLVSWKPGEQPFPVAQPPAPALSKGPSVVASLFRGGTGPILPALTTGAVRRDALLAMGGFDERFIQFDSKAWLRLLLRGDYLYLPVPLSLTRIHGAQVTAKAKHLRLVDEAALFWREFAVEAAGRGVAVGWRARLLPLLRSSAQAASKLHALDKIGRPADARAFWHQLPWKVKGLVLLLLPRTRRQEKRRLAALVPPLTWEEVYPG